MTIDCPADKIKIKALEKDNTEPQQKLKDVQEQYNTLSEKLYGLINCLRAKFCTNLRNISMTIPF